MKFHNVTNIFDLETLTVKWAPFEKSSIFTWKYIFLAYFLCVEQILKPNFRWYILNALIRNMPILIEAP